MQPRFLLVEACDFIGFPVGGQLSMARAIATAFGDDVALVGWGGHGTKTGQWTDLVLGGTKYRFFPFGRANRKAGAPLVPRRVTAYCQLRRYRREVLSIGCSAAFMMAPETLLATSSWGFQSICFHVSGVNPILSGRYAWARLFEQPLERAYLAKLGSIDRVLAAADETAIAAFSHRSKGSLTEDRVVVFPTCVDTTVFKPANRHEQRMRLRLPATSVILASAGRLSAVKGWRLLLEAFAIFAKRHPDSRLVFVGDGEDRGQLERQAVQLGLSERVTVTGFVNRAEVAAYLNAADAVLVGSTYEGWSVAMLEALACGKPIVSTAVSGATAMISEGRNGFVVPNRCRTCFAEAITAAIALPDCTPFSTNRSLAFSVAGLRHHLEEVWPAIR